MKIRTISSFLVLTIALVGFASPAKCDELSSSSRIPQYRLSDISLGQQLMQMEASNYKIMTSPSQLRPAYKIIVAHRFFEIAVDENKQVVFISSTDPQFKTPEGIRVGDSFDKIRSATTNSVSIERGWCWFVQLPSGWHAAFTRGKSMTDENSPKDLNVRFLFKRK